MALEAQFLTQSITLGVSGVDLHHAIDKIDAQHASRFTNLVRNEIGELTARPGLTSVATAVLNPHHTISRLDNVLANTTRIVVGAGASVYTGTSGILALSETGFSGSPLTFVTYRPPFSSESWMFVGDRTKFRKIRSTDGLSLPIGLPAPPAFVVLPVAANPQVTIIDNCDAAGWTNNNGTGAGAPANVADAVNKKEGAASVQFTTNAPAGAYFQYWNKANALNLNLVGAAAADDDDLIHLWLRLDRPDLTTEVRLYFVVSAGFNTATLPGTSTTLNTDAYVKSFRSSDFTPLYEATSTTIPTASTVNSNAQTLQQLAVTPDVRPAIAQVVEQTEPSRGESDQVGPGRGSWTEYGALGRPVRRGDFRRIGTDSTRSWGTVTGLVVEVAAAAGANINIWFDDIKLTGGNGPDNAAVGNTAYDYRVTNYDPRTGAESNPSPIMTTAQGVDALRQSIFVTPPAYADPNVHQRFYRRGGALSNNWYFVTENAVNGLGITDTATDASLLAAATLRTDNDQPVTTLNQGTGATVLASPIGAIWGPLQDILFACGDLNRPGYLYWSRTGYPDSWPAANSLEVCSPSEALMTGCVWGGQAFAYSRQRQFALYPNVAAAGTVVSTPTACTHGVINRWALAIGPGAMYFVGDDGVYSSTGGAETNISDDMLSGLFHGETRNGYLPIDFAVGASNLNETIRLTYHDNELWLFYVDTGGTRQCFIYSILYSYWRAYTFTPGIISGFSDHRAQGLGLLLGGTAGITYSHTGTSDNGTAIACNFRTGALDQGYPRQDKLYGDLVLDVDRASTTITVTPYINNEVTSLAAQTLTTGSGRTRYTIDPFGTGPQQARNLSIDIGWSSTTQRPTLYFLAPSYIVQPDTTVSRYTDWSAEGRRIDKYVKGLIIECDTGGAAKTVNVEADGVVQAASGLPLTVTANGRRVLQFSFAQIQGRLLRIHPTDTSNWKLYSAEWIFDEEPLQLARWETQEIDHGIPTHHALLASYIALRSNATVFLTITGIRQTGATFSDTYQIASTGGIKLKPFVPFNARKAVLWKYLFFSELLPFWLYKEESEVIVQPWAGEPQMAHPFGNSDNQTREMRSSALTALASGGRAES